MRAELVVVALANSKSFVVPVVSSASKTFRYATDGNGGMTTCKQLDVITIKETRHILRRLKHFDLPIHQLYIVPACRLYMLAQIEQLHQWFYSLLIFYWKSIATRFISTKTFSTLFPNCFVFINQDRFWINPSYYFETLQSWVFCLLYAQWETFNPRVSFQGEKTPQSIPDPLWNRTRDTLFPFSVDLALFFCCSCTPSSSSPSLALSFAPRTSRQHQKGLKDL